MSATLNKFWIEFIELYKSLPELWKQDSDDYSNRNLRKRAYEVMLAKYHEIDKEANLFAVKKKINNIRTSFRREFNKVKRSQQTATNPNEIYVPTLWYYDHMDFLMDEEDDYAGGDTTTVAIEEVDMDEEYQPPHRGQPTPTPQPKKRKFVMVSSQNEQPPMRTDPSSAISGSWEALYRELDQRQKLYANRMITEVLYQAALGRLHENSYKLLDMTVEDTNEAGNYSSDRESETQYYLTESPEPEESVIENEMLRKRPKTTK
ncbi:uncharacterized protein LOC106091604 [Stomoxys calcitrans]|uniref:MADF domain-containing protein n=1 Tax=Stomoxys calcitrans TaxID=35570 RepID=A0A1I8P9C4_STOCA|nr:uncharacterized protein LOC106091604 [Stomoxys calcitrans]